MSEAHKKLYTSLVRAKQAVSDGRLPPMTPLTVAVATYLDPAFTIGMGALAEDGEFGLRCPVRGCGVWRHRLSLHLNTLHADIGGAAGVKKMLDIPPSVTLASAKHREVCRQAFFKRVAEGNPLINDPSALRRKRTKPTAEVEAQRVAANLATYRSMNFRNLRNQCETQIAHKLIDLHHKLGRSPSGPEARAEYGHVFVQACVRLYGTWNNAKAQQGLETFNKGQRYGRERVLQALGAWYDAHKRLPSSGETRKPTRFPFVPGDGVICKALKVASYPEAMEIAAVALGIPYRRLRRAA